MADFNGTQKFLEQQLRAKFAHAVKDIASALPENPTQNQAMTALDSLRDIMTVTDCGKHSFKVASQKFHEEFEGELAETAEELKKQGLIP